MPDDADAPQHTLYLIDGHAQIFRAYYAIRGPMSSPVTGEPTNATFAFTGMLLKLFDKFHPRYVVMAIDTPGKTFRDEMYPEYKAGREAPPEDFDAQLPRIFEITKLFGIPVLGLEGVEADDIIATVAQQVLDDPKLGDVQIRIVSKDKDLEQLLGERVTMFDIHTDTMIDMDWLKENKGITPDQAVELQTLTGDKIDNVPGVVGVGDKTAAKLIREFGSVDNLLANLDRVKGKRRENIEKAKDTLPLTRQLVTLKRDVPLDFTMGDAEVGGIDGAALRQVFKQMGFNRHSSDLDRLLEQGASKRGESEPGENYPVGLFDAGPPPEAETPTKPIDAGQLDYRAVTTKQQLDDLVTTLKQQSAFAVDTETIGLGHDTQLCGISLAWEEGSAVYVPVRSPDPRKHLSVDEAIRALKPVLEDESIAKWGHNLKYDYLVLERAGITLRGAFFDSMIAAFLLGKPGLGLDHLAMSEFGHEMIPITALIGPRPRSKKDPPQSTIDKADLAQVTPYAAEDADFTLRLCRRFIPELKVLGMTRLADEVEMPLVEVLARMEANGVRVDPDILGEQRIEQQQRIEQLRDAILESAGVHFNPDSPKQLGDVLFNQLKFPIIKKTKSGYSTDIEVLERLSLRDDLDAVPEPARKLPELMIEYRMLTKLVGTYFDNLRDSISQEDGRIHATFVQTGAATGRLASNSPNLQNIPIRTDVGREIRKAFVAEPGCLLVAADYSQVELRLLAHLSDDENLLDAFRREVDIHTAVAAQVFKVAPEDVTGEQRAHAKVINFGIIYGITPFGLARRIEGLDRDAAAALINDYKARFPGIEQFLGQCVAEAHHKGYVTTMLGRRRAIPEVKSRNPQQRQLGERLAINTVVQGSAADLIKLAMVNLHRRIAREKLPMKLLLQIHDELVVESPKGDAGAMARVVAEEMEGAMTLKVPVRVESGVGANWFEAKA